MSTNGTVDGHITAARTLGKAPAGKPFSMEELHVVVALTQRRLSLLSPKQLDEFRQLNALNRTRFVGHLPTDPIEAFAVGVQTSLGGFELLAIQHDEAGGVCEFSNMVMSIATQLRALVLELLGLPLVEPLPSTPYGSAAETKEGETGA